MTPDAAALGMLTLRIRRVLRYSPRPFQAGSHVFEDGGSLPILTTSPAARP